MPQPAPRPGSALFEQLFGRPPEAEAEEAKLRTLFELLGATLDTRGKDYLAALAAHLTDLLHIDLCLITRVDESNADHVTVIAQGKQGKIAAPGMRYSLRGTPCEMVMQGVEYYVADGVAEAFPLDAMLVEGGFRSYFGFPLWGDNDDVIGKICLLDVDPMPNPALARELAGMFVQRASAEVARVRARQEAQAADETLQRFMQDFPGWVCAYETGAGGKGRHIVFSSDQGAKLLGPRNMAALKEDATVYNTLLHPEEREHVEAVYVEARRRCGSYDLEYRIRQDDGQYRWVQATGCFSAREDGSWIGHSVMLDRDSYRRLERKHEELLHEMHTLVGAIPDAVLLQDGLGRVRFLNHAAEELFGLRTSDFIGHNFATLADRHPEFDRLFLTAHANTHAAFTAGKRVEASVSRIIPGDSRMRDFETVRIPLFDEEGNPSALVTILRDVTAREEARAQAEEMRMLEARAARLAALSRLVDGVAHEFENQLTAVLGYGELGEARVRQLQLGDDAEVLLRSYGRIREAAQTASELTRNLLAFGGSRAEDSLHCEPLAVIRDLEQGLQATYGADREFSIELQQSGMERKHVHLSPDGFADLLGRILRNAFEATEPGGRIELRIRATHDSVEGTHSLQIAVQDDGMGVPSHLHERVFDPLYSTREKTSRRRGMGLAVAHNLALCAGGSIRLAGDTPQGACFEISLPLVPAPVPPLADGNDDRRTILLVDDQAVTRELMAEVLAAAGFAVTSVAGCEAAREIPQDQLEPDLILVDVFLEDGLGTELVTDLRQHWPSLRALFCSGMPAELLENQGVHLPAGYPLLKKPFRPTELLTSVGEILGTPDLAVTR